MNTNKSALSLFIFLAIVGLAFIVLITFVRAPEPGGKGSTQASTSTVQSIYPPGPDGNQTVAAIVTSKAIGEATYLATTRTPEMPIYLPTGIYDDQRVKISAASLFIDAQNAWSGIVDGQRFTLYAGALQSDPEQGVVFLISEALSTFEQFVTPTKHGALRALDQQNDRVILVALDGTMFYFDVPTRQFVDSLTGIAPSVTPSPIVIPVSTSVPYPPPIFTYP